MITFIKGTDSYRVKTKVDEIVDSVRKNFTVSYFDLSDVDEHNRFTNAVKTVGLFATKEIYVLKNAFDSKNEIHDLLVQYDLVKDSERQVLIFESKSDPSLKKSNKALFQFLTSSKIKSENISNLNSAELSRWITSEVKKHSLDIDSRAVSTLIGYCVDSQTYGKKDIVNPDLTWRLHNEIEKLCSYKKASGDKRMTSADVELLVHPVSGVQIFGITDSLATRNVSRSTVLIDKTLAAGTDPYYLFTMIVYQFRNLLTVKSMMKNAIAQLAIVSKTKLHPYVIKKTSSQAGAFGLEELKQYFTRLHDLEIDSKSGRIDLVDGLYQFVFAL